VDPPTLSVSSCYLKLRCVNPGVVGGDCLPRNFNHALSSAVSGRSAFTRVVVREEHAATTANIRMKSDVHTRRPNDELTDRRRKRALEANPAPDESGALETEARGGGSVERPG
jgi:hypothetical protein